MKIGCTVVVVHRIQTPGTNPRSRPQHSSLSLVKNPKDESEVFIIHQTAQNNGTKYKINDNIAGVFTKFLSSGKATIRFKIPAVDVCIECDVIQLKCFLTKLKLVLQGKESDLKLMSICASTQVPQKPKTKLIIKRRENYDLLVQYPRTLEIVEINNVNMSSIDLRIFKLRHLKILNLEGNSIQCLPEEIGKLQIQEFRLGSNFLGHNQFRSSWKWLSGHVIQRSLVLFQIDNNKLQFIPNTLVKLRALVTLKLDNNLLEELPVGIGKLKKLKYLHVSNNKLKWLPATLRSLRLSYLDFSYNEFLDINAAYKEYKKESFFPPTPTLRELSALATIFYRVHYDHSDIPVTLQEFLAETSECFCRNPTFTSMPEDFIQFTPRLCFVNVVNKTPDRPAIFKLHYCSFKCYVKSLVCVHTVNVPLF